MTGIRECNSCTACCHVLNVKELDKPIRVDCPHQCKNGCRIYEERPESCRIFMCVWARGFGNRKERPDKLGLFVEERPGPPAGRQYFVKEVRLGAARSKRAMRYLTDLKNASGLPIFLTDEAMEQVIAQL